MQTPELYSITLFCYALIVLIISAISYPQGYYPDIYSAQEKWQKAG